MKVSDKSPLKLRPSSAPGSGVKKSSSPQRSQNNSWTSEQKIALASASVESLRKSGESHQQRHQVSPPKNKSPGRERDNDLIHRDQVPPSLAKTLDHIIGQVSHIRCKPLFVGRTDVTIFFNFL